MFLSIKIHLFLNNLRIYRYFLNGDTWDTLGSSSTHTRNFSIKCWLLFFFFVREIKDHVCRCIPWNFHQREYLASWRFGVFSSWWEKKNGRNLEILLNKSVHSCVNSCFQGSFDIWINAKLGLNSTVQAVFFFFLFMREYL